MSLEIDKTRNLDMLNTSQPLTKIDRYRNNDREFSPLRTSYKKDFDGKS